MEKGRFINIVGTRCKPELEDKFNEWYDEVHVPLLMEFHGIKKASRFKLCGDPEKYPAYLAIYEFENEDGYKEYMESSEMHAALEEMKETWGEDMFEVPFRAQYELMREWNR